MATYQEPIRPWEWLLVEFTPGTLSREKITVVSGAGVLLPGTVLGKITASGKYKAYDDGNTDGSQTACAILAYEVDASAADVDTVAVVRLAEVKVDALQWATAVDATAKTKAYSDLTNVMIRARVV